MMTLELEYFFLCSARDTPVTHPHVAPGTRPGGWARGWGHGEGGVEAVASREGQRSVGPSWPPGKTRVLAEGGPLRPQADLLRW